MRLRLPHRRASRPGSSNARRSSRLVERLRRQEEMQREQRAARFETGEVAYEQGPLDSSAHLKVGRHSYIVGTPGVVAGPGDEAVVRIGSFCSIAAEVLSSWEATTVRTGCRLTHSGSCSICLARSRTDTRRRETSRSARRVDRARRAHHVRGHGRDGAVVGAAAVVAADLRPYAIVVGNPAREVRRRFGEEAIAALERIAWWDWPDERIVEAVPLLSSAQIDRFITEHSGGEVPAQGARPAPPAGADPSRVRLLALGSLGGRRQPVSRGQAGLASRRSSSSTHPAEREAARLAGRASYQAESPPTRGRAEPTRTRSYSAGHPTPTGAFDAGMDSRRSGS